MRILLYKKNHFINTSGGAEKIMVTYANELSRRGYKVILATRDEQDGRLFFPLDKDVIFKHFRFCFSAFRRFIGKVFAKAGIIRRFPYFNRELSVSLMLQNYCRDIKPDVIIVAGMQELIDFSAYGTLDCPVILMMHSHPKNYFTPKRLNYYKKYINNAAAIQVLMPSFVSSIPDVYGGKIIRIGNPVAPSPDVSFINRSKTIIYAARIEKGKQQHLLIEAFAKIAAKYPDWQVHFYGAEADKKYASYCNSLIIRQKLEHQVIFKGVTTKITEVLHNADICAFPSACEGFGLALTEAMAAGLPAIGFEYCSGVNELIENEKNGFLVKDADEFAEKLAVLMDDEDLRCRLGREAMRISFEYGMDNIMRQWEDLIKHVCA